MDEVVFDPRETLSEKIELTRLYPMHKIYTGTRRSRDMLDTQRSSRPRCVRRRDMLGYGSRKMHMEEKTRLHTIDGTCIDSRKIGWIWLYVIDETHMDTEKTRRGWARCIRHTSALGGSRDQVGTIDGTWTRRRGFDCHTIDKTQFDTMHGT